LLHFINGMKRCPGESFLTCFLLVAAVTACDRQKKNTITFDEAGEVAQKALSQPVNFTLTDNIYRKWERAQANLDRVPSSDLANVGAVSGSDPVDVGVRRLESSPAARLAIESAGISVRDFVLATLALGQAIQVDQNGVVPTVGVLADNVAFVRSHSGRLASRGSAGLWVPPAELSDEEMRAQMRYDSMRASSEPDTTTADTQTLQQVTPRRDSSPRARPIQADTSKTDSLLLRQIPQTIAR
jgi:hypothetical protein